MCGRYRTTEDEGWADLRITPHLPELFDIRSPDVRPSQVMPVLVNERPWAVRAMRWGFLPVWAKSNARPVINARAETLFTSPWFREAARLRRGIVASTGFYEWEKRIDGPKLRYTIVRRDRAPLLMACVYEQGRRGDVPTYAIVTCDANATVRPIHDRMPVVLEETALDRWLDPGPCERAALEDLLVPVRDDVIRAIPDDVEPPRGASERQMSLF